MFEYIKGELTVKKVDYIAIDINGLAYKVYISLKTYESLSDLGSNQKVYIYTNVKEDNISFYGFKSENERELFRSLVSISGVGPKLALAILSTYNTKDVIDIVLDGNVKLLTKVPGLGDKKAQKLILDLKDKVKKLNILEIYKENGEVSQGKSIVSDTSNAKILMMKEDLKLALESLGYSNPDLSKWIKDEELAKYSRIEDAIKVILQKTQIKK